MKRLIPIIAALALAGPAFAHADEGVMHVQVADLDLDSDAGAAAALARIKIAARQFCGDGSSQPIIMRRPYDICREAMLSKAVEKLDAPRVTALHQPASHVAVAKR